MPSIQKRLAPSLRAIAFVAMVAVSVASTTAQFDSIFDSPGAAEQFRLGVQAYHMGRYSEAIFLFEKALAYAPDQALIQYWRGRAYYKNGFEETALRAWQPLLDLPDAPPSLRSKAELVRSGRSIAPAPESYRFVEVARFEGKQGRETYFSRPSAMLPRPDGTLWVVAHGSNELLRLDVAGTARERLRGGLAGFDRPFGIAQSPDGSLFVTEFNGDRIVRLNQNGSEIRFGQRGRGPGALIGPQYAAIDSSGYLYVVDFGNARVSKYSEDGAFILSFGGEIPESGFPGFESPTGILAFDGEIFVADSQLSSVYRFDESGNYLGVLAEGALHLPEGLAIWEDGRAILVADTDRVAAIDIESENLVEVYRSPDKASRIVGVVPDRNGDLIICDFDGSYIAVLSELSLLAAGYDVEIERIIPDEFPKVYVDVKVRDRSGTPIVGLSAPNFYLAERIREMTQKDEAGGSVQVTQESLVAAHGAAFEGAGDADQGSRIALLLERSSETSGLREPLRSALADIYRAVADVGSPLTLVAAGNAPVKIGPVDLRSALAEALRPAAGKGRFDLGLRLAATSLLPSGNRDAVLYLGTGRLDEASFVGTTLSELASLLRNNGLRFFAVVLEDASPALLYLAERTGGSIFSASRPGGLGDLGKALAGSATGRYRLSFESRATTAFGRAYLTVSVEAYLFKKSGKDELGYFAPLE
jgi:DNA-binding beta-propeller fold protein YncE